MKILSELKLFCNFYFYCFLHQPKVVTATDEAELARQMERAEAENAEVAGDDEDDDDEPPRANTPEEDGDEQDD